MEIKNKVKCPFCNKYTDKRKCKCGASYKLSVEGLRIWRKQLTE